MIIKKHHNMQKRTLTQEDIDNNPELADNGLKVGDEIEIPEQNSLTDGDGPTDDPEGDTGGSNPPPSKERP